MCIGRRNKELAWGSECAVTLAVEVSTETTNRADEMWAAKREGGCLSVCESPSLSRKTQTHRHSTDTDSHRLSLSVSLIKGQQSQVLLSFALLQSCQICFLYASLTAQQRPPS